jgi:hypothetical protein
MEIKKMKNEINYKIYEKNISKTRFVESCVEQILLREEKNALEKMTREQLIHLILSERG